MYDTMSVRTHAVVASKMRRVLFGIIRAVMPVGLIPEFLCALLIENL